MEIKFDHAPDDSDVDATVAVLVKEHQKYFLVGVACLAFLVLALFLSPGDGIWRHFLYVLVGAYLAYLAAILSYKSILVKSIKSVPGHADTNSYVISGEGIHAVCPCCSGHLKWNHFQSFVETDTHFFLMKGNQPKGFPKRIMSPADQDAFRILLKEKLPTK